MTDGLRADTLRRMGRGAARAATTMVAALLGGVPLAAQTSAPAGPSLEQRAAALRVAAAQHLLRTQGEEGAWAADAGPGPTALVVRALVREPGVGPDHPAVRRGVEFVLRSRRQDGGIYAAEGLLKSYETSVALSMFSAFSDRRYESHSADALRFLKENQWDEGDGKSIDDPWYGGAGYGRGKRPDLSNTQIMLDALHDSGLPPTDPAYQKALRFIERCQMLGERNDQAFARGSTAGGFIYSPANGGESKAGEEEIAGRKELRCYGSMTYAGFKSMLYAGLKPDDPRVRAAVEWIRAHWTLDYNPNMPEKQSHEGLYYYYHTFARAMAALGQEKVEDRAGRPREWRRELIEKLAALQKPDGSWVNEQDRWMEGLPALTTAYALLALQEAAPATPAK